MQNHLHSVQMPTSIAGEMLRKTKLAKNMKNANIFINFDVFIGRVGIVCEPFF